jgi:hypothetical protein
VQLLVIFLQTILPTFDIFFFFCTGNKAIGRFIEPFWVYEALALGEPLLFDGKPFELL